MQSFRIVPHIYIQLGTILYNIYCTILFVICTHIFSLFIIIITFTPAISLENHSLLCYNRRVNSRRRYAKYVFSLI